MSNKDSWLPLHLYALLSAICILSLNLAAKWVQIDPQTRLSLTSQSRILPQDAYFQLNNAFGKRPEFQDLNAKMQRFMKIWQLKGASLAIAKDGKLVYCQGFGEIDQGIPCQPYHQFRIASVSKLFTAAAIMQLQEKGLLRLQDRVFGPKGILNDSIYQVIRDPLAKKIEVQHLLRHTAGWRNQLRRDPMFAPLEIAQIMQRESPPPMEVYIQYMLQQDSYFEPGTLYDYSNFGYCVLGEIIEKVSGQKYEEYIRQHILAPSGIRRMFLGQNRYALKSPQEARYYPHAQAEKKLSPYGTGDSVSRAYEGTHMEALGPAGGWVASPLDLIRLSLVLDQLPGQKDILSSSSIEEMIQPLYVDSLAQPVIGWKAVDEEKWWRTGSLVGTGAVLARQHNGITWAFLTNTGTYRGPYFSYEVEGLMRRALAQMKSWPKWDLFVLAD